MKFEDLTPDRLRRPVPRRWLLGTAGLFIAVSGWQLFRLAARSDPEPWLAEARRLVAVVAADSDATQRTAAGAMAPSNALPQAAALLEQYLAGSGREMNSARLLLAATRTTDEPDQAKRLLNSVGLSDCPAADLDHAALLFFLAQRYDAATSLVDAALARTDSREQTLRTAALMRFDLGLTEDVLKCCQEWSRLAPHDPQPWRLMCFVYDDRGATELAIIAYHNLLERSPDDPGARRKLVDKLIQLGDVEAAREQFDHIPEAERSREPELKLTAARLFYIEGRADAALGQLDTLLHSDPDNPAALLLRGKILLSGSELMLAIAAFNRALQKDPTSLDGHYLVGQAYARLGDEPNASKHLARHEKLRRTKVLINSLETEAARKPNDVAIRRKLVELYNSLGLFPQAQFWANSAASMKSGQQRP